MFPPSLLLEQRRHLPSVRFLVCLFLTSTQDFLPLCIFSFLQHPVFLFLLDHSISMTYCGGAVLKALYPSSFSASFMSLRPFQARLSQMNGLQVTSLSSPLSALLSPVQTLSPQFQQLQQIVPSKVNNLCAASKSTASFYLIQLVNIRNRWPFFPTWSVVCSWLLWYHVLWLSLVKFFSSFFLSSLSLFLSFGAGRVRLLPLYLTSKFGFFSTQNMALSSFLSTLNSSVYLQPI